MSRALLYSREGLFSLKGGSGLREGDLLFHKEPSPIEASAICCLPPARSSPFSPSAPFYCKPAANKDKSTMNSSAPGRHCPLQLCKPSLLFSCTLPSLSEHSISPPSLSNSVFCVKSPEGLFFPKLPFYFPLPPHVYLSTASHSLSGSEVANTGGERANEQSSQ